MVKKFAAWLLRAMVESGAFDEAIETAPFLNELCGRITAHEGRIGKLEETPTKPTQADAQNAASILWAELFGNETQRGGDNV